MQFVLDVTWRDHHWAYASCHWACPTMYQSALSLQASWCFPLNWHQQLYSVCSINGNLRREIPAGHVFQRHESGFTQASPQLFLNDHVHLNTTGMHQYWTSVKTALLIPYTHWNPCTRDSVCYICSWLTLLKYAKTPTRDIRKRNPRHHYGEWLLHRRDVTAAQYRSKRCRNIRGQCSN